MANSSSLSWGSRLTLKYNCTIGSAGDVNPFIGIGQELKKRGFRVVLITSQYFETQARSAGLEFLKG
jgi:UDP:flavonoid glycosyltransferase YjiC (YdhE family)